MLTIDVMCHGALVEKFFHVITLLLGSTTFATAVHLSLFFAIIGATYQYITAHDVMVLVKWFVVYFILTVVLLGPKVSVDIHNASNPKANYHVAAVPVGLAIPAAFSSNIMYGLIKATESLFHQPWLLRYSHGGLLYNTRKFLRFSTSSIHPLSLKISMQRYIAHCVLPKFSHEENVQPRSLVDSVNLSKLIFHQPSPIFGFYLNGQFNPCAHIAPSLRNKFFSATHDPALRQILLIRLIKRIAEGKQGLYPANHGVNGVGLLASVAYVQIILCLLVFSLFPLVILLGIQPHLTGRVLRYYGVGLGLMMLWPWFLSVLNSLLNILWWHQIGGLSELGLTIGNFTHCISQEAYLANLAGYLAFVVPIVFVLVALLNLPTHRA